MIQKYIEISYFSNNCIFKTEQVKKIAATVHARITSFLIWGICFTKLVDLNISVGGKLPYNFVLLSDTFFH